MTNKDYQMPKEKKNMLSDGFLTTLREALDDEVKPVLLNRYIVGTDAFDAGLKTACEKHNLTNPIYLYSRNLEWNDRDDFESDLLDLMYARNILMDFNPDQFLLDALSELTE